MTKIVLSCLAAMLLCGAHRARADDTSAHGGLATPAPVTPLAPEAPRGLETALTPGLEIFAQYTYRRTLGQAGASTWFHQFEVPRVWAFFDARRGEVRARVLLEGVRSASEGALVGVAGDSLLARLREAWVGQEAFGVVDLRAGLVPTFLVPTLDETLRTRVLGPMLVEASRLSSPADLGAQVRVRLPGARGWVGVAVSNGEGYTSRELNRGKSPEAAARLRPFSTGALSPLSVLLTATLGSTGPGSARADRLSAAVLWEGVRVRAGAVGTYALGADDVGSKRAYALEVSARVEPVAHLSFSVRASSWRRDTSVAGDSVNAATVAAGVRLDDAREVFVAFTRAVPGGVARAALPGSDSSEVRVVARVGF